MAEIGFSGGDKLEKYLADALASAESAKQLSVGFMSGATYPDGTKVAYVAAINNYGAPRRSIPPRPFFSGMVEQKSPGWGDRLGKALVYTDFNGKRSLELIGAEIAGDLQESIIENDIELSPITVMLRGMRSQGVEVTGKTVGEAAKRVANGDENYGASTKPLVDTGHMLNSVQYDVDDEIHDAPEQGGAQ